MLYICGEGCEREVTKKTGIPAPCEPHGRAFFYSKALGSNGRKPLTRQGSKKDRHVRRGSPLKRTRRRETAAEKRARRHFNGTVKSWPCWFSWHRDCEQCEGNGGELDPIAEAWAECPVCEGDGRHHCTYPKDAHHLVPKAFLRQRFEAILPEDRFVAILFNPLIGAPLCRKAHDAIESGADRIYWEDLSPECLEYVGSLPEAVQMRLELECPKRPTQRQTEGSVATPEGVA